MRSQIFSPNKEREEGGIAVSVQVCMNTSEI